MLPKKIRALFYAVNGLGLGHLTRMMAVARELLRTGEADVLFLSTSNADNILSRYGIPYIHLPSKTVIGDSETLTHRKLARIYNALVNPLLDVYQPHVLVVDTMVTGSMNDLLPYLRYGNAYKVYMHRARKPEAYQQSHVMAQRFYDLVVAPHYRDKEIIPMPLGYDVPLYWSGPVMFPRREDAYSKEEALALLGLNPENIHVLITLGGGGDRTNAETLASLRHILQSYPQITPVFAEGLLPGTTGALPPEVKTIAEFPLAHYFPAFDFAISAAGYNTFHELLHFGVPAIFVPKPRGYDDQTARATAAAKAGACLVCAENEDFETEMRLAIAMMLKPEYQLQFSEIARQYVPENHAGEVALTLLEEFKKKQEQDAGQESNSLEAQ